MNKGKQVILSHSGKQHSYHVAKALSDLGCLERFYTSSYVTSRYLQHIIQNHNNQFWSRRFINGLPSEKVEANWLYELKETVYSKLYGLSERTQNAVYERDVRFDKNLARRMKKLKGDIYWGFQGSCYESLRVARQQSKIAICELSTAHAPAALRILGEEKKLHVDWADSFDNLVFPAAYYQRLCNEPYEADLVIGASQFTLRTLREEGIADSKLRYLPLGFDVQTIPFEPKPASRNRTLKLLYAGRVTQRKGIVYALEALCKFPAQDVELHIIGNVHGSGKGLLKYKGRYHLHGPVSQQELYQQYRSFDALLLPSVFEGFGLVIVEAMAAGLPVITTPNTIGPELIITEKNGYIVPIRDVDAIKKAIEHLLLQTNEEKVGMCQAARDAALNFTWTAYRERLAHFLETLN